MEETKRIKDDISVYMEDQELIANTYVIKCFSVMMIVYSVTFLLNLLGIFVIEQSLMLQAYLSSLSIYFLLMLASRFMSASNPRMKYFLLFCIITVLTITGVFITYHVVLISLLPFLYATLYSSKKVTNYVYVLTVISTVIVVYGGYYFGLCDANMVLLTTGRVQKYISDGQFALTQINSNPHINLMLFFVVPRCLIYIAFVSVCRSIFKIVSGSLEKAKVTSELEKARFEAESASKAKSRFLARVSHEIRTPINAVMGMNEMILRESSEENVKQYARDVKESSVVLLNLIDEILDSSKIESGKMEIVSERYDIGSLFNDLYNMINVKAREKGLELEFEVDSTIPRAYLGDEKRIHQVLLNLLSNSIKYTDRGKVVLKVTCERKENQGILLYSVKDTGIGIRSEDIGKIYDEFQRFDVSRNRNVEGTGLGMNIVQQILKLMGSELEIKSEYGAGSEFSFAIVQEIVDDQPLGDFRNRIFEAQEKADADTTFTAPEARILVVDDYPMNLEVFRGLLKRTHIQIDEAESGEECLKLLRKTQYDIIFLDHMMPGMDGIETLHIIQEQKLCQDVPIIMLTANAIVGDKERYLQEGFDDFLTKPIIPKKLDRMLLKHLPDQYIIWKEFSEAAVTQEAVPKEATRLTLETFSEEFPEIDLKQGLLICAGNEEFYFELFGDFTKLPIKEELVRYLEKGDFKNYCIRIHGFKNSAYSMGATAAGDLAFEMEKMTKDGFPEAIHKMQKQLFEIYDAICQRYRKYEGGCL